MPKNLGSDDGGKTYNIVTDDGDKLKMMLSPSMLARVPPPAQSPAPALTGPEKTVLDKVISPARPVTTPYNGSDLQKLTTYVSSPRPTDNRHEFMGWSGDPTDVRTHATPQGFRQEVGGLSVHDVPGNASDARGGARPPPPPKELTVQGFEAPAIPPAAVAAPSPTFDMNALLALGGKATGGGGGTSTTAYDAAQKEKQAAITALGVEDEKGNNESARLKMEGVKQEQAFLAEQKERQAAQQKALSDSQAEYAAGVKALETPSGTLDPNRWWASRDTGQKIASFASAFLSGFSGRPDAIQQAIDADIAAQKYNFERMDRAKGAKIEGLRTIYSMNMDRFKDENAAAAATRAQAWDIVTHQIEATVAGTKGASARPQAALMIAGAKEEAAKYKNQLAEQQAAHADRNFQRNLEIAKFQMEYGLKEAALAAKGAKGAGGKQLEQSTALQLGGYDTATKQVEDLRAEFRKKIGAFSGATRMLPGTSAAMYEDLQNAVAQTVGIILEHGKLAESDLARYKALLAEPADSPERAMAKLDNLQRLIQGTRQGAVEALGNAGYDVDMFRPKPKPTAYIPDKKPGT